MTGTPEGREVRRRICEFIASSTKENGWPPTVREIGAAVGLSSTSTVHAHLAVLQREGVLVRDPSKPRAVKLVLPRDPAA